MSSSKADMKPGGGLFPSAYAETSKTKKHKKKKHKRHRSSSSDNSGGDQWVEATPPSVTASSATCAADAASSAPRTTAGSAPRAAAGSAPRAAAGSAPRTADPAESDGWAALLGGVTSEQSRASRRLSKQAVRAEEERQRDAALQKLQYRPAAGAARAVGDSGAGWLRRALERAEQQARAQGRPLEELVEERWGSMDRLQEMLDAAEGRKRGSTNEKTARESPRRGWRKCEDTGELHRHERKRRNDASGENENSSSPERKRHRSKDRKWKKRCGSRDRRSGSRDRRRDSRDRRSGSRERRDRRDRRRSGSRDRRRSGSRDRRRDSKDRRSGSRERRDRRDRRRSGSRDKRSGSRERRDSRDRRDRRDRRSGSRDRRESSDSIDSSERRGCSRDNTRRKSQERSRRMSGDNHLVAEPDGVSKTSEPEAEVSDGQPETGLRPDTPRGPPLSDSQMNALAARVLKAELGGDEEEAAELKAQLEAARQQRQTAAPGGGSQQQVVVVLPGGQKPATGRTQRPKKVAHKAGERAQYFADDGKQNLQQMFEREKRATAADGAAALARLAARGIRQKLNDDYDADDVMTERAARAEPAADQQRREAGRALALHRRTESCRRCLDSRRSLKHLVVSVGEKVYLAIPAGNSLTPGHCRLLPRHHVSSLVELEEDAWEEMGRFRSALVKAFACRDQQVVFFERAAGLAGQPHAELDCVPVPREEADMAPIYFRKAIEESETEWSQNKKVVDLRGRGVRRAVPRGLPYFFVDFGVDPGFAHVIEDEELFTADFAAQVIGGMLELEPTAWRKSNDQPLQQQLAKVKEFNELWSEHDFTKSQKAPDGFSA